MQKLAPIAAGLMDQRLEASLATIGAGDVLRRPPLHKGDAEVYRKRRDPDRRRQEEGEDEEDLPARGERFGMIVLCLRAHCKTFIEELALSVTGERPNQFCRNVVVMGVKT